MKLEIQECKPSDLYIQPCLLFAGEITYADRREAILAMDGHLRTDDNRIISEIKEIPTDESRGEKYLAARGTSYDNLFVEKKQKIQFIAPIDKIGLNYIEDRRLKIGGDVKLNLSINVRYLLNRAVVSNIYKIKPRDLGLNDIKVRISDGIDKRGDLLASAYDTKYSSNVVNLWPISGDSGPIFLSLKAEVLTNEWIIAQSDWIKGYASQLGLGRFYVIELKKEEKKIEKAWSYLSKADECYLHWDLKGVYANCRELMPLVNKLIEEEYGKDSFIYKERWGRAVGRFEHLVSLALHIEEMHNSGKYNWEEIEIRKAEADHIILVSKALIKYAEDLIQERQPMKAEKI